MSMSRIVSEIMRASTPPPFFPLTPPPTGGFGGRGSKVQAQPAAQRTNNAAEGESLAGFFEEPQGGSDIDENETVSRRSSVSSLSGIVSATPASEPESVLERARSPVHEAFQVSEVTTTPLVSGPFSFLKLPVSVRNKIYEHLLVVPGLICVRQNQAVVLQENDTDFLHAQERQLHPGVAHAFVCVAVNGRTLSFGGVGCANINILLANKEIFAQAKPLFYGKNSFEVVKPSTELSPPPDFKVRLFPSGCQRLVTKLNFRIRSFYDLTWLFDGGHVHIKNFYRGLKTLTLVLELPSMNKGFARMWARHDGEKWAVYVQRLRDFIAEDAFCGQKEEKEKEFRAVPGWINLSVLFSGEGYIQDDRAGKNDMDVDQRAKREELRDGLLEAWELIKKSGR